MESRIIGAAAAPAVRRITVDAESAGQRLDNFLLRELKGVPKTHVYRVIRSGEVRVNKGRAAADTRVAESELHDALGLDVEIKKGKGEKGELRIRYTTLDQLEDVRLRLLRRPR